MTRTRPTAGAPARAPRGTRAADRISRERIFAAAAREFAARGFAGANVDRIAAAARVNKAMIYYHFRSKAALYREILARHVRRRRARVGGRRRIASTPPKRRSAQFVEAIAD